MAGKDKHGVKFKKGEGYRKSDGLYYYRWTDENHKRHTIYAPTLGELREKEKQIQQDIADGISTANSNVLLTELCEQWFSLKRRIKASTREAYRDRYECQIKPYFAKKKLRDIKPSDIKRFYCYLNEDCGCSCSTIHQIHAVLRQVFEMAVDDSLIRVNPTNKALNDFPISAEQKKRIALTIEEQQEFFRYIGNHAKYRAWEPICSFMVETGLRIGEATGLQWSDVDFTENIIHVRHTLLYLSEREADSRRKGNGVRTIQSPKSKESVRDIPLTTAAKAALERWRTHCQEHKLQCKANVDGFTDFIFFDTKGNAMLTATLNSKLNEIRKCHNESVLENGLLLPSISSHIFRHTYATRMTEKGIHPKLLQVLMGHSEVEITMNVYTDISIDYMKQEVERLNDTPITTPNKRQVVRIYDNIYQLPTA